MQFESSDELCQSEEHAEIVIIMSASLWLISWSDEI